MAQQQLSPAMVAAMSRAAAQQSGSERRVTLGEVASDTVDKFRDYMLTLAWYGVVPLSVYLGARANDFDWRDLSSGLRVPLWD